jgi:formylglycine-generating enzyme required for sulfatase activity
MQRLRNSLGEQRTHSVWWLVLGALAGCAEPISGNTGWPFDISQLDSVAVDGAQVGTGTSEVEIPAGPFWMGCSPLDSVCADKPNGPENPLHKVTLTKYSIDLYETTVAEYTSCVDAGVCTKPPDASDKSEPYNYGAAGREQHPINGVTWQQAATYCKWRGKRLPTEAEWEKAARGGCELYSGDCAAAPPVYPWGQEPPDCTRANYTPDQPPDCGNGTTLPVGSLPAGRSPYGLWDMAGNVWEWTSDWYQHEYYAKSPEYYPQGPLTGEARTRRGGAYSTEAQSIRVTRRHGVFPDSVAVANGIRCARSW